MAQQLRLFFIALQFLTRLPTPASVGFEPAWLNASARYFPLVGTLVGTAAAGVLWAASQVLPAGVAAGLSIVLTLLLTGAFHEDGLADTCDALGGSVDRDRALEIMKDSRIGSYGAVGLIAVLGLKATALAGLLPLGALAASIVAHTASRAVPVLLIRQLPYAGRLADAKAKPLAQTVSAGDVGVALGWTVLLAGSIACWQPGLRAAIAAGAVGTVGVALTSAGWLRRRLGGYTGDTLGATQQVAELLILLLWLGAARWSA